MTNPANLARLKVALAERQRAKAALAKDLAGVRPLELEAIEPAHLAFSVVLAKKRRKAKARPRAQPGTSWRRRAEHDIQDALNMIKLRER